MKRVILTKTLTETISLIQMMKHWGRLTLRGPRLNGMNLEGFSLNWATRSGSSQRSGLNISASSPHNAGFRCVKKGKVRIGVLAGMYTLGWKSFDMYVGSECGKTMPSDRVSRMLEGRGVNSRSVSFSTARTVNTSNKNTIGWSGEHTIFKILEAIGCRNSVGTDGLEDFPPEFLRPLGIKR